MRDSDLLQRWLRFNGVGALGIAVQLGVLAMLVGGAGAHYLAATVIAVEAAVLHNFCWHERWTWVDRPSGTRGRLLARLVRFHLLNGAISFAGNLLLMRVLTGSHGVDPLAANIFAVIACSLLNFGASELLVFRHAAAGAALLLALQPAAAAAADGAAAAEMLVEDLRAHTLQAWHRYEQQVDARYDAAAAASAPFFALDAYAVSGWRAAAMGGSTFMSRLDRPRPGYPEIDVDDGKIHHWVGAIFVPNTSVGAVLKRLDALAGREQDHYEDVIASRLLSKEGNHYRIFMKIRRTKIITVTYNTEHDVRYLQLSPARATGRSASTRIAQLRDAGTPREAEMKIGSDEGYLWRLNAYWRYEAVNGGVLIECESVSLSRGIPLLFRPFFTGAVEGVARDSLERTLVGLRRYLTKAG